MMINEWCYARIGVRDLSSRIRRRIRSKQLSWFNACAQQLTSNLEARPKSLKFTVAQDTLYFPSAVHNVLFVQYVTFSLCSVAPSPPSLPLWIFFCFMSSLSRYLYQNAYSGLKSLYPEQGSGLRYPGFLIECIFGRIESSQIQIFESIFELNFPGKKVMTRCMVI